MPNTALLKRAAKGDIASFEGIIIEYEKLIYNLAYRLMNNKEDARDICQEVYIKIFRNLDKCAGIEYMKSWVCTITRNACMDELRRRKGKASDSYDEMLEINEGKARAELADRAGGPEDEALKRELSSEIGDAINRLSNEHKELIVLRDIQGMSYEEIAEITHSPLGTVKSRLSRARNNLKKLLEGKI